MGVHMCMDLSGDQRSMSTVFHDPHLIYFWDRHSLNQELLGSVRMASQGIFHFINGWASWLCFSNFPCIFLWASFINNHFPLFTFPALWTKRTFFLTVTQLLGIVMKPALRFFKQGNDTRRKLLNMKKKWRNKCNE